MTVWNYSRWRPYLFVWGVYHFGSPSSHSVSLQSMIFTTQAHPQTQIIIIILQQHIAPFGRPQLTREGIRVVSLPRPYNTKRCRHQTLQSNAHILVHQRECIIQTMTLRKHHYPSIWSSPFAIITLCKTWDFPILLWTKPNHFYSTIRLTHS